MKKLNLTFLLILLHWLTYGQVSLSGEIRPRLEFRNGYGALPPTQNDPAFFISQRTRLSLSFNLEKITGLIQLQDARVWGEENQMQNLPSTALHQGWVGLKAYRNIEFRFGRQEFVYDNHRLLGNVDWIQQARSHDAALLKWNNKKINVDFGAAYNQNSEANFGNMYLQNNYKILSFLRVAGKLSPNIDLSFITIVDGFQKNDTTKTINYRYTSGGNLIYTYAKLKATGVLYYQGGNTTNGNPISAYFVSGNAEYKQGSATILFGTDLISGTSIRNQAKGKYNSFNTLYATNHKFYGTMDYFINIPKNTSQGGLIDYYGKIRINLSETSIIELDYHYFSTHQYLSHQNKKGMGSEIDLIYDLSFWGNTNLKIGYSMLFANQRMELVSGGNSKNLASWGWVMLTVKPTFFTTDSKTEN